MRFSRCLRTNKTHLSVLQLKTLQPSMALPISSLQLEESLENDLKALQSIDTDTEDDEDDDNDAPFCTRQRLKKPPTSLFSFHRTNTNACLIVPNHFRITPMTEIQGKKTKMGQACNIIILWICKLWICS